MLCTALSTSAMADVIACDMGGLPVHFAIDDRQFAPAIDAADPPRRQMTTVQMGDTSFIAEPLIIEDARGFWAEPNGAEVLLVMQADGTAVYTDTRRTTPLTGTCEVLK